jgi:autotransporter-associated beta strand protein
MNMKIRQIFRTLTILSLLGVSNSARAGSHTWSGAVNNSWSNAGNWSAGGAPQFGEPNITLIFPPSAVRYASTNGVGQYAIDSIVISGDNYSIGGYGITLTGVAYYNLNCTGTNNVISLPMTLNSSLEYFLVDTYDSLTLNGAISGPGGYKKFGRGTLTIAGPANNSYATPTTVLGGTLVLAKPPFTTAVPTELVIGDSGSNPYFVQVTLENDHQIDDSLDVTVNPNCTFYLKGHMEVIKNLHLAQGWVATDVSPASLGQLTIFGGVTVTNSFQPSTISGQFSLSGAIRTIDVGDNSSLQVSAIVVDGGQKAGIAKTGLGKLILSGANSYSGDTTVSAGVLEAWHGQALGLSSGNAYIQDGAALAVKGVNILNKHLFMNGLGFSSLISDASGALFAKGGNSSWTGPITLQGDSAINVATNLTLTLSGVIDGPGSLTTRDWGTVQLAGSGANKYTGGTYAEGGTLVLGKTSFIDALPGHLVIGVLEPVAYTNDVPQSNVVRLIASHQIPDNAPVDFNPTGLLDLNGYFDGIGELTMIGGRIETGPGLLTLHGNVTGTTLWNNWSDIAGNLSLGGATRTFTTLAPGAIVLEGVVSDGGSPAGIIKMGTYGGLRLDGTNNTYSGVTTINEGWASAEQPGSLGSPAAGVVVGNGAMFEIGLNFHGPVETLTLLGGSTFASVGINSWDGNIILNGNAEIDVDTAANNETLDINGVISGTGNLTMNYGGTIRLTGASPNTYNGRTFVLGSTLWNTVSTMELRKSNGVVAIPGPLIIGTSTNPPNHETVRLFADGQIADSAAVTLDNSGLLDLNSHVETVGSLAGSGNVGLILGSLTVGGNNFDTTFSGVIAGVGFTPLIKEGTGNMTLTGTNTCSGKMIVNNGSLYVNGSQTCGVQLNANGKLHGQGTVGVITGLGGWTIPGDNLVAPTHGQLKSGTVNLDNTSDFNIDLGGTAASGKYDRLKVTGLVALGNATLHLTQSGMAKTNDQFIIIDNDGAEAINGTFNGLPENSILALSPTQVFKLSYSGGDGNDVVLTQLATPPAPSISGITNLPNSQIQLTGSGVPNWVYTIQASEDLGNPNGWHDIGTATADVNGKLTFLDPDAPNYSYRFYRFVAP